MGGEELGTLGVLLRTQLWVQPERTVCVVARTTRNMSHVVLNGHIVLEQLTLVVLLAVALGTATGINAGRVQVGHAPYIAIQV